MISAAADTIVTIVRAGHRRRSWLSAAALILTLVVASGYLFLGALRVNPLASSYRITVAAAGLRRPVAESGRDAARRADRPGGTP